MRIALAVREGILKPEQVAIYFFSLDDEGYTTVREIPLDAKGNLGMVHFEPISTFTN
jgi:hypothetical protein